MNEQKGYRPATSNMAVRKATGRTWAEWFERLDAAGAEGMDHKGIVAWLRDEAGLDHAWWQQNVTVEYEKARGLRAAVGETADAGFQVGAQRTFDVPADAMWRLLTQGAGLRVWLGADVEPNLQVGDTYRTAEGVTGEIRTMRPGERLRLTWRPVDQEAATTLQVTVTPKDGRCTVGFHHERLPDPETRQAMRERWRGALTELGPLAQDAAPS